MEIWQLIGDLWNWVIIQPMINSLLLLYSIFFNSFGLSIIIFTIIIRAAMFPLTIKQSRQIKSMGALQPRLKELQERHKDDRSRLSQETMRVYREHGVNPIGCLGPMLLQFPIWIGLYRSIILTLPSTPESLVGLSRHLYPWLPRVHETVPLDSSFLWMDLATKSTDDPVPFLLPVLVGGSMFFMQKMTTMPSADARQASTNRMMLWMLPLMFGWFTLTFPSGLALYWIVSNIIGIAIQGFITGWGPLTSLIPGRSKEPATAPALVPPAEEKVTDADDRNGSEDERRGSRNRPKGARRRARRGRNRRH